MLQYDSIPGLFVYPDYFAADTAAGVVRDTLALYARLEAAASGAGRLETARIPQPEFVRSAQHNLASEEFYTPVALDEADGRRLSCEYFPRYGEDGHALAYFRGNANLPAFVAGELLAGVRRTMEDAGLIRAEQEPTWRLTVNVYKAVGGTVAGFPFHVDIPANGVVTMILNVQREALFQITRDGGDVVDVAMPVGCLLVLSGESRYEWKHRVLPMAATGGEEGGVGRVSLVLGFR